MNKIITLLTCQDLLSNFATITIFLPTTAILFAVTRSVNFANLTTGFKKWMKRLYLR